MTVKTLEELAAIDTDQVFELKVPLDVTLHVREHPSPHAFKNLEKLRRLGICTGDAVLSILAQAPIDPINLMATLMRTHPIGWTFSVVDFSMARVIARTSKNAVMAALHVDLMSSTISGLALNAARQLTIFKTLEVDARPSMLKEIAKLEEEAIIAAQREQS